MPLQVSAPGKVLILGGYLIVEPPNVGVSIGVNARFVTIARKVDAAILPSNASKRNGTTRVKVHSPQFHQSYTFTFCAKVCDEDDSDSDIVTATQVEGRTSPFIQCALLYAIAAARAAGLGVDFDIELELRADNDFYSQRNYLESQGKAVNTTNLRSLPVCMPLHGAVSKTGLGSSAAMNTSIVGCLLQIFHQQERVDLETIHRVAQVAHVVAQGKVGSGFDVCTAVYGTCAYRRFSAERVDALLHPQPQQPHSQQSQPSNIDKNKSGCTISVSTRRSVCHDEWNKIDRAKADTMGKDAMHCVTVSQLAQSIAPTQTWATVTPFRLPPGLHLILADVHRGGTNTPSMVNTVMRWRTNEAHGKNGAEGNLWSKLAENNEAYLSQLVLLNSMHGALPKEYSAALQSLQNVTHMATHTNVRNDVARQFIAVAELADRGRHYLREMGEASGAHIEPPELTVMLDRTAAISGVLAVGCPGAGGYDAVFALVIGEANVHVVEQFWERYDMMQVCPLLVCEDSQGIAVTFTDD